MRKFNPKQMNVLSAEIVGFAHTNGGITDEQIISLVRGENPKEVLGQVSIFRIYEIESMTYEEFIENCKNNTFRYRRFEVSTQRDAVWTPAYCAEFIQCVFTSYSVPEIVLNERNGLLRIIDGNNRRRALYGFYNNFIRMPSGTSICGRDVSGMSYGEIMADDDLVEVQNYINTTPMAVVIYKGISDAQEMEVFCQRNKGIVPNPAEKRNGIFGDVRDEVINISRKFAKMYGGNKVITFDSDIEQDTEESFKLRTRYSQEDNNITSHIFMFAMKFNSGTSFNGTEVKHATGLKPMYKLDSFNNKKAIKDAKALTIEYMNYVQEGYKQLIEWKRKVGYDILLNVTQVCNIVLFLNSICGGKIKQLSVKDKKDFFHSYFNTIHPLYIDETPQYEYGTKLVTFKNFMDKYDQKAIDLRMHIIYERFCANVKAGSYVTKESRGFTKAHKITRQRADGDCDYCNERVEEGDGQIHHMDYHCNGAGHDADRMMYVHKHCHLLIHNEYSGKSVHTEEEMEVVIA